MTWDHFYVLIIDNMSKIIPAEKFVLLKPLGEQKLKSGVVLPEDQTQKPTLGVVYLIGKGKQPFAPAKIEKGDTVMYKKYMSNETIIPMLGEVLNPIPFEDLTVLIKKGNNE